MPTDLVLVNPGARTEIYQALGKRLTAVENPIWAGLITNRAEPKDGIIQIPQGPGFGLALDGEMIRRYRLN